ASSLPLPHGTLDGLSTPEPVEASALATLSAATFTRRPPLRTQRCSVVASINAQIWTTNHAEHTRLWLGYVGLRHAGSSFTRNAWRTRATARRPARLRRTGRDDDFRAQGLELAVSLV